MKPGRELDARVAERVMGLHLPSVDECLADAREVWKTQPLCRVFLLGYRAHPDEDGTPVFDDYMVPAYSTDIAAAWEVVEKILDEGYDVFIENWQDDEWLCSTKPLGFRDIGVTVCAPTAPLAICLAALKAVGAA